MDRYIKIPSAVNNLKRIIMCYSYHTEFLSTYYNDKLYIFRQVFGEYIKTYTKEIDYPVLIQEWKLNLDKSAYKNKMDAKERLPSNKKEIYRHDCHELWPKIIIWRMQWYTFQGIMLHTEDNIKCPEDYLK